MLESSLRVFARRASYSWEFVGCMLFWLCLFCGWVFSINLQLFNGLVLVWLGIFQLFSVTNIPQISGADPGFWSRGPSGVLTPGGP